MNKIILEADTKFEDTELRKIVEKLISKLDSINERTKGHTIQINRIEKEFKELNGKNN